LLVFDEVKAYKKKNRVKNGQNPADAAIDVKKIVVNSYELMNPCRQIFKI
jgi:hypothetical protein